MAGAGGGAAGCLNGGVWLTENGGKVWKRVLGQGGIDNHPANPQVVECSSTRTIRTGSWLPELNSSPIPAQSLPVMPASLSAPSGETRGPGWKSSTVEMPGCFCRVLAGGDWGLSLLTRSGDAVTVRDLPGSWPGDSIRAADISGNSIIIGTRSGKVYRTPKDFTSGWQFLDVIGDDITDLATSPLRPCEIYAAIGGIFRKNLGIRRSVDGGDTWTELSEGLASSELIVFDLEMSPLGDRLYAGTPGEMAIRPLTDSNPSVELDYRFRTECANEDDLAELAANFGSTTAGVVGAIRTMMAMSTVGTCRWLPKTIVNSTQPGKRHH